MIREIRRIPHRWVGCLKFPTLLTLVVAVATACLTLLPAAAQPVAAQATTAPSNSLANVPMPQNMGASQLQVYVPQTGHTLTGIMLDYWRANGAASIYGDPISEPYAAANGLYSQAFQAGIFQYLSQNAWSEAPKITLMPVNQTILTDRLGTFRADGRRGAGGGDRRVDAWTPLSQDSPIVAAATSDGGQFDTKTGHTISDDFLKWYNFNEGPAYLGDPLSQPLQERGVTVQYFQGALVMENSDKQMSLAPVVQEHAAELGIDTSPVDQGKLPDYSEALFQNTGIIPSDADLENAGQYGVNYLDFVGNLNTPGRKWVEVSLSKQQLWAYQGNTVVMTTPVSTGLAPNLTAPGVYHIYEKLTMQTMAGYLGPGDVNYGNSPPPGGGTHWVVPNVPNVMYFSLSGDALHGTYWHHNFGNPMSHGCVNLPLQVAAWMWGWAPMGTEVWVHQ